MHVNRFQDLKPYQSPGHWDMRMFRVQGREAGPADTLWLGMSQLLPGGHIDLSASGEEKFYVVLEGEIEFSNGETSVILRKWDSLRVAPNEPRALLNKTNAPAIVLLAMPLPKT